MSRKSSVTALATAVEGNAEDDAQALLKDLSKQLDAAGRAKQQRLIGLFETGTQRVVAESARAMSEASAQQQRLMGLRLWPAAISI